MEISFMLAKACGLKKTEDNKSKEKAVEFPPLFLCLSPKCVICKPHPILSPFHGVQGQVLHR